MQGMLTVVFGFIFMPLLTVPFVRFLVGMFYGMPKAVLPDGPRCRSSFTKPSSLPHKFPDVPIMWSLEFWAAHSCAEEVLFLEFASNSLSGVR